MRDKELLWEIPLACLSFLFYKAMKFVIGNLFTIYLAINQEKASQWRVLSAEMLNSPLSLPVLMTKGPRWNTHAIISTLGPFKVESELSLDTEIAKNSSQSWIAILYSFPGYKTIATLESGKCQGDKWESLELSPGKYTIGLRYYGCSEEVRSPIIKVDGKEIVDSQNIPADVNQFYHHLQERNSWFYLGLHYYIYTLLRLRKWFPESFVKREFLPVGATDTQFFYGNLEPGQSLQLEVDSLILSDYNIYFTRYNRASFPVSWFQLQDEKQISEAIETKGFYLIRIRQRLRVEGRKLFGDLSLESRLNNEDDMTLLIKAGDIAVDS